MFSYAKLLINPYVIGFILLVGFGLYHFYSVSSLKREIAKKESSIDTLTEEKIKLLDAQTANTKTINNLKKELSKNEEIKDSLLDNKDKTILSLSKMLTDEKAKKYQHIYTYDKCVLKIKGDNNETSELVRVLSSIGV